jgi:hypothetical protein
MYGSRNHNARVNGRAGASWDVLKPSNDLRKGVEARRKGSAICSKCSPLMSVGHSRMNGRGEVMDGALLCGPASSAL